ncbi:MAG: ABC transporter permease [Thermoleophilaceae bacterium]
MLIGPPRPTPEGGTGSRPAGAARRVLRRSAPPAGMLLLLLAGWQALAGLGAVDPLLLPSPLEVVGAARAEGTLLLAEGAVTMVEVVLGLGLGLAAGMTLAVAMHAARPLARAAYPLLVASQAVPVIVIAPLLVLAFDYGIGPKVAIVALVCFFPVVVGALDGLRSVEPGLIRLMRSLGASRIGVLGRVELPASLPHLFSGVRIAASVAVIGAVFGEWAGADAGLGRLVLLDLNQLETARVYAGVTLLGLMAVALFALVGAVERLAVPWAREASERSA